MNIQEFELAIMSYCETVVVPQLVSPLDRFLLFFALGAAGGKMEAALQKLSPVAANLGLIDIDGHVNIDLLEKAGLDAFEHQPKLTIWKLTFTREDFADFIRHLRG